MRFVTGWPIVRGRHVAADSETERDVAIRGRICVGRYVRQHREDLDMTQRELEALVDIGEGHISKIEGGTQRLPSSRAALFAKALAIDPTEFGLVLFGYDDPHVFALVFPSATLEPLAVPDEAWRRAKSILMRQTIRKQRARARQA